MTVPCLIERYISYFGTPPKYYLGKTGSKWTFRGKKEKYDENWHKAFISNKERCVA